MFKQNIPQNIFDKIGINNHNNDNHPICLMKKRIYNYFDNISKKHFDKFDDNDPIVSIKNNFDSLLIPKNHPSRSKSDTYYISDDKVLRTHTSAHQTELLAKGYKSFLVCGDVYRKDEIDRFHYPVFHQMEGVYLLDNNPDVVDVVTNLKATLSGLIEYLFPNKKYRFNNDYFPFTDPSFEIEVLFGDKWLEILGCGVIHPTILFESLPKSDVTNNRIDINGWAFGIGLERLCMILYNIPDIRLFWSRDEGFLGQFRDVEFFDNIIYTSYSVLPLVSKDVSFWLDTDDVILIDNGSDFKWNKENDFYDLIRSICDDNIEKVELFDHFHHKKKNLHSNSWRLTFSCIDATITNPAEFNTICNNILKKICELLKSVMNLEIR